MKPLRSPILDTTVRFAFDAAAVLSVYLLFAGHNQPGGGFVGGLVLGAAIGLRYVAGGLDEVRALARVRPASLLSFGLGLICASALGPLLGGSDPLDHRSFEWDPVVLGHVKVTTATIFDAGVYLVVVGLVLMVFEGLGETAQDGATPREGPSA